MKNSGKKVIVAMSGGVDSSVSAALLKEAGFNVTGIFMKCWSEEEFKTGVCTAAEDERWARRAAAKIGIPFYSLDLVGDYRNKVVEYFIKEYKAGRTPNPDIMCNKEIKFGVFYDICINELKADFIATGHYARVKQGRAPKLLKGVDPGKDQSYFLWAVGSDKLKNVMFPVGGYLKSEVRELAKNFGLPNAERKDSQGICFIGELNINNFLNEFIREHPGDIINRKGEAVGKHSGLHHYTIGQRKGINIGGGPPYYVASKDFARNALIVSREHDDELFGGSVMCSNVNWHAKKPKFPFACTTKIRYRQADQDATIIGEDEGGNLHIEFKTPQRAITSGQSAVFYKGDELVGGGVII